MKNILIILFVLNTGILYASDYILGFLSYTRSTGGDEQYNGFSQEIIWAFEENLANVFDFGVRASSSDSVVHLGYRFTALSGTEDWSIVGAGVGASFIFGNGSFGIAPEADVFFTFPVFLFKFALTFRYNIYFNTSNNFEIGFKIGIFDFHKNTD